MIRPALHRFVRPFCESAAFVAISRYLRSVVLRVEVDGETLSVVEDVLRPVVALRLVPLLDACDVLALESVSSPSPREPV